MIHFLKDCKCTEIWPYAPFDKEVCYFCYSWQNTANTLKYNHYFTFKQISKEIIKIEKDYGRGQLQEIETGITTLMRVVRFTLPYWCVFLIVECDVNVLACDKYGKTALDYAMETYNFIYNIKIGNRSYTSFKSEITRCPDDSEEEYDENEDIASKLKSAEDIVIFLQIYSEAERWYPKYITSELDSIGLYNDIANLILLYIPRAPKFNRDY